jgi:hypothetical protein
MLNMRSAGRGCGVMATSHLPNSEWHMIYDEADGWQAFHVPKVGELRLLGSGTWDEAVELAEEDAKEEFVLRASAL